MDCGVVRCDRKESAILAEIEVSYLGVVRSTSEDAHCLTTCCVPHSDLSPFLSSSGQKLAITTESYSCNRCGMSLDYHLILLASAEFIDLYLSLDCVRGGENSDSGIRVQCAKS